MSDARLPATRAGMASNAAGPAVARNALQALRARELFFAEGRDPTPFLDPHISRSWLRCRSESAEDGHALVELGPVAPSLLRERREQSMRLLECAQPELDFLSDHALDVGCVVILSDATGLILDEIGSADFLPKAQRVALTPGVVWSEGSRGTNAIGTALMERQALMVLGHEHYLSQNGALGCAAAPIFTGRGDVAGVLDISGETAQVTHHALGLVRLAAQQVEHRMMLAEASGHLLRFHTRPSLLGTSREGLLVIDDGRLIAANRVALDLLGSQWTDLLDTSIERLIGLRWTRLQKGASLITLPNGQQIAASVEASLQGPGPHRFMKRTSSVATTAGSDAGAHSSLAIGSSTACLTPTSIEGCNATGDASADVVAPLLARAVKVLNEGLPVLVSGETGSGKEVFARRLHDASSRSHGPFIAVNCAALPETLIEAELFGYEAGAFTGARRHGMPGRIREAHGGILFLDEIGDMPLALQTRLLRVVEDRVVTPLGGSHGVTVDFRLVCATHRRLDTMVADGTFRADLRYRINGFEVSLPALRDRSDRPALIDRLFEAYAEPKRLHMDDAVRQALAAFPWPGNVRELCAVLRTSVALAEVGDTLTMEQMPEAIVASFATSLATSLATSVATPAPANSASSLYPQRTADERQSPRAPPPTLLSALHHDAIDQALADSQGNIAEAARRLGIHRSTLYRRAKRDA
jgi:transcriptional regulator of acetoin/glycerol metabolism